MWSGNSAFQLLIVTAGGRFTGLFVYSGSAPAHGNLVASIAAQSGTDPFGNTYQAGIAQYATVSGDRYAVLLNALSTSIVGAISTVAFPDLTNPPFVSPSFGGFGNPTFGSESVMSSGIGVLGGGQSGVIAADSLRSGTAGGAVTLVAGQAVVGNAAPSTTALLEVQGVMQTTSLNAIHAGGNLQSDLGDIVGQSGNLLINAIGKGLRVKEGSGAKQGTVLLAGGTATVNNTNVTTASRIFLTAQDNLSTGALRISARTAGTSFTITSSNAGDSGSVAWEIFEPA